MRECAKSWESMLEVQIMCQNLRKGAKTWENWESIKNVLKVEKVLESVLKVEKMC